MLAPCRSKTMLSSSANQSVTSPSFRHPKMITLARRVSGKVLARRILSFTCSNYCEKPHTSTVGRAQVLPWVGKEAIASSSLSPPRNCEAAARSFYRGDSLRKSDSMSSDAASLYKLHHLLHVHYLITGKRIIYKLHHILYVHDGLLVVRMFWHLPDLTILELFFRS